MATTFIAFLAQIANCYRDCADRRVRQQERPAHQRPNSDDQDSDDEDLDRQKPKRKKDWAQGQTENPNQRYGSIQEVGNFESQRESNTNQTRVSILILIMCTVFGLFKLTTKTDLIPINRSGSQTALYRMLQVGSLTVKASANDYGHGKRERKPSDQWTERPELQGNMTMELRKNFLNSL